MAEYLLEVRSQEMPGEGLQSALRQLGGRVFEDLMGRGVAPEEILTGLTPRRLVLCCRGLPEKEPDRETRELGPPADEARDADGQPTEALLGFAERVSSPVEALSEVKTERGVYLALLRKTVGRPIAELLAELIPRALADIRWPARQRFAGADWVRPLRGVLSILDGEVLPLRLGKVEAGRHTAGHPILSPDEITVDGWTAYLEALAERGIEVSWERRRQRLAESLAERAKELGGHLSAGEELLGRLAAGCEIPGIVSGAFDSDFLSLPGEILEPLLAERQGALVVRSKQDLLPFFVSVIDRPDDPEGRVRAGLERSVAGGLADIEHHMARDRRRTLAERARGLDQLGFHPKLGHLGEKSERVASLVALIASGLGWEEERETAEQAALLAKADLTCETVRESPRLRGTLGGVLAREEGYVEGVWRAIAQQYRPGANDAPIPDSRGGLLLAVADRLDTLVGLSALGELPRGGKDPLALRRLTLGLLRILLEGEMELDLDLVTARTVRLYGDRLPVMGEELLAELQGFLAERVRHLFGQRGFAFDEIEAVQAVDNPSLADTEARLRALSQVREDPEFRSLVLAAKRIANMVSDLPEHDLDPELLSAEAELELHRVVGELRSTITTAVAERRYDEGLRSMVALVPVLDRFFAEVLVMDENEARRNARIALLQSSRRLFWRIARIKQMVVEKGDEGDLPPLANGWGEERSGE